MPTLFSGNTGLDTYIKAAQPFLRIAVAGRCTPPAIARHIQKFLAMNSLRHKPEQIVRTGNLLQKFCDKQGIVESDNLTSEKIQQYLSSLLDAGLSPKTVRNHRTAIFSFCKFLQATGVFQSNPCYVVPAPPLEEHLPAYLDEQEYDQVLEIAREDGIYCEVCLALNTGLRASELRRLQWKDVNLRHKALYVTKSKSRRIRKVDLNGLAYGALLDQHQVTGHLDWVFPAGRGGPGGRGRWTLNKMRGEDWWKRVALKRIVKEVPRFSLIAAGSVGHGWHLFRHTFASRAVQRGVPLLNIKNWLGHKDINTTTIYAHLSPEFDELIELVK